MAPNPESLFHGVPGPTPWYARRGDPVVEGFHWEQTTEKRPGSGVTLLVGNAGAVAALNFYNYVMRLDSSTLLIWNQRNETDSESTAPVHLVVIKPSLLPHIRGDLKSVASRMKRVGGDARLALSGPPVVSMDLNTSVINEDLSAAFPEELQPIEELLILCHSSAIAPRHDGINANLALLVAKPRTASFRLYPQDWFNSADLDFGYQWVTRVARDPETGRVRGEGFRIAPFELDGTLRNVVKTARR